MASGFGEDDAYNVYDQPWRKDTSSIYRPSKNLDKELHGDDLENLIKTKRFDSHLLYIVCCHQKCEFYLCLQGMN